MAKSASKGASASNTTKTSKAAKGTAVAATEATPATAPAEAKAKRPPAVVQNGVQRPRAGGLCAAVWEITENLTIEGELPAIGKVKAAATEAGLNATNVSIEYYRCRQFHGVRGRKPKVAEQAQA